MGGILLLMEKQLAAAMDGVLPLMERRQAAEMDSFLLLMKRQPEEETYGILPLLTGSAFALVLSYCVRFFAIAQGAADGAMGRVSPSLPMAARSLGRTRGQTLREVYFPLIRASVGSALLLVFVDCVKELPATMLLRPFNFDTLATRVHDQASLENLGDASPGAILIVAIGMVAVGLLARANR